MTSNSDISNSDISGRIVNGRQISGMSSVLLPYTAAGSIDWESFDAHVNRTLDAGLGPAVNMDTGYVQLLSPRDRAEVLSRTKATGKPFVAGAIVLDSPGDAFDLSGYAREMQSVAEMGGTPIIFPSNGLNALPDDELIAALQTLGSEVDTFLGFELGPMFVPYGRIYTLDMYEGLMGIQSCIGAKHSSLNRVAEFERLALRDKVRPDFRVFTGNDLAIDMVTYGSDYLLGLSTFAPDLFGIRDKMWANGDAGFHQLNDLLQYLGEFVFRSPVPAYRHNAAMFMQLRGWASSDHTPPGAPRRPDSDREILADILRRMEQYL